MFKQMLADNSPVEQVLTKLRFPLYASPKLDGIRGTNIEGSVLSRNLKPLPNVNLQKRFGWDRYDRIDGEFCDGDPTDKKVFSRSSSVVMSREKPIENLKFYTFDFVDRTLPYYRRYELLKQDDSVLILPQTQIDDLPALLVFEDQQLHLGYEGLILRDPEGGYKFGRSTLNQGWLLKLKRFTDSEAVVIGFEERMHNANDKTLVKNGKEHRSSHKAGLEPLGTLGALTVRWGDVKFNIGSGFDAPEAQEIWDNQDKYIGKLAKFKYFNHGIVDAPRHPVFLGWRDKRDMS